MGTDVIKEQFKIGSPLDVSILDRKCLSRTWSHESITEQMSKHKGNTQLEAGRSRYLCMAEQTT